MVKQHVQEQHKDHLDAYECDQCSEKFALNFLLVLHQEWHKKAKSISCSTCNAVFFNERKLKAHIRDNHASNYDQMREKSSVEKCCWFYKFFPSFFLQIICAPNAENLLKRFIRWPATKCSTLRRSHSPVIYARVDSNGKQRSEHMFSCIPGRSNTFAIFAAHHSRPKDRWKSTKVSQRIIQFNTVYFIVK